MKGLGAVRFQNKRHRPDNIIITIENEEEGLRWDVGEGGNEKHFFLFGFFGSFLLCFIIRIETGISSREWFHT